MLLTIILHNNAFTLETNIADNETVGEFIEKNNIYSEVPLKYKALIFEGNKIGHNEHIMEYINKGKLHFWFQLRWFERE
jgi:hypothetical protein